MDQLPANVTLSCPAIRDDDRMLDECRSQMELRFRMPALAVGFLFSLAGGLGHAQSSAVPSPQSINSSSVSIAGVWGDSLVPVMLSDQVRQWERILSATHPEIAGRMTAAQLLAALKRIGLPVDHDYTAVDDHCDSDTELFVESSPDSLYRRIEMALKPVYATLTLKDDQFSLISIDYASDPEFFCIMIYDISRLDADPYVIEGIVRRSIEPDSWDDTTGDGSIQFLRTNGRQFFVVSQTWQVQMSIRKLFGGIGQAVQTPTFATREPNRNSELAAGTSVAVAIPVGEDRIPLRVVQQGPMAERRPKSGGVF